MPVPRRFDRRPPERDQTRINDRIRVPEVRLIDETGKQVGVVKTPDALRYAEQHDLDLVEVAPDARPPVCRVLDYSKYKYEQAQKLKAARKHQQQITIREIKFRPKIAAADYDTKKGHVERFLRGKDKVKVTIMFRGREQAHPERGTALLQRLAEELSEVAVVEQTPLQDGRNMTMMLGPSKSVLATEDESHAHSGAASDASTAAHQGKTSRRNRAAAVAAGLPEPVKAEPSKTGLKATSEESVDELHEAESVDSADEVDASVLEIEQDGAVEPEAVEVAGSESEPTVEADGEDEPAGEDEAAGEVEFEDEPAGEVASEDDAEAEPAPAKPRRAPSAAAAAKTTPKAAATKSASAAAKTTTKPAATKAATTAKAAATKTTAAKTDAGAESDAQPEGDAPAPPTRRRAPAAAKSDS